MKNSCFCYKKTFSTLIVLALAATSVKAQEVWSAASAVDRSGDKPAIIGAVRSTLTEGIYGGGDANGPDTSVPGTLITETITGTTDNVTLTIVSTPYNLSKMDVEAGKTQEYWSVRGGEGSKEALTTDDCDPKFESCLMPKGNPTSVYWDYYEVNSEGYEVFRVGGTDDIYWTAGKDMPVKGAYIKIEPKNAGEITLGVYVNKGNHPLYIVEAATKTLLPASNISVRFYYQNTSFSTVNEGTMSDDYILQHTNGETQNRPALGYITFPVEAGKTYYAFNPKSQLGCYGFKFVKSQTWAVPLDFEVSSGASVTSVDGVTLNIGNARDGNTWTIGDAAGDLGEGNDVLGTTKYIRGSDNAKTAGSTTKAGKVPETGTYYQFILTESGKLTVGVNWGMDKIMRLADADGDSVKEELNDTGAYILGTREFTVPAGTYYLYAEGSKLGLFGFSFAKEEVVEDTGTPHEAQAWDFTSNLSEADKANIAADGNWTISNVYVKDADGNNTEEVKTQMYEYTQNLESVPVTANDAELELTKGLKFKTGASKFQYYDGERLNHGGTGHGPIIPKCAKGDIVKIRYKINEGGRGFGVNNAELTEGTLIGETEGIHEATMTIKKKGYVIFSSVGGTDILALAVNMDLPKLKNPVTITANSYTIEYGDALPQFEYTVSGGTYNGTPKITCSATSSSDAGTYDINIAAGSGTNYNVTYVKGTLTIKKAVLTASVGNYTRKQGEANPAFTISYSGFKKNQTKSVLTKEPTASCSATPSSAPGSYPITLSGGEAKNYEFNYQTGILTVEQRDAVTITANSYTIEYGDPLPNFGYTTTGVALSGTPTVSCAATSSSNAGTYTITVNKGSVSNEEVTFVNGTLTIRKATLTASVGSYTKKQGDAIPTFSISYSGFKNGETKSVLTREPTASCSATASSAPGSYPITLSGGQATNYEFNYQNGTLTVIAADAAAVTARSYTITYGDPLPQFEYDTSGVTLNGTPAISCSATANSDAGTYDIVVSKGSVSNYNVSYVNGTLTIKKAVLTASAGNYSRPQGFENPVFSVTYEGFKNNEDQSVLDTEPAIKCDATKDSPIGEYPVTLSGGTARNYSFKYINGMLIIADYLDINNVSYSIKSNSERTMTVGMKDYQGHVTIPASVELNGLQYKVVGIETSAFAGCDGLVSVTLPNTLQMESVGRSLFSVCRNLAAINWEASFPMTEVMLGGVNNPNLLFYTKNAAYAPSSVKNVVVNGTAEEITLTDAQGSNNFYCPTEFTARKISYTHNYKMTSGFGGKAQGWETIALPFDVNEIRHASKGTILPFAAWNNSTSAKPFWLCSFSANGFTRASSIQANTPYIICMPNNEEYDTDYILSGSVTFSATNAKVKASSAVSSGKSGTKTFIPAFCAQEKSGKVYALNVNNDIHSERGGYDEGSRFVSNLRTVSPFEAYMTDSSAGAKQAIDIEFSDATGIDELTGDRDNGTSVYTIMGQKVKDSRLKNGTLPQGIYIKNGRKVSIRK